ncbi:MAG TPA: DUF3626 domain-containing protein [Chroococcales cyanobacterium]
MDLSTNLVESQRAALEHIAAYARTRKAKAQNEIAHVLQMSNVARDEFESAVLNIKRHARVGLHFHPDRPDQNMCSIAESLLDCGMYKSQFETLLSNGSISAVPGGERDQWEEKIFGGAYQREGVKNRHRPKYGALNLMLHPDGPSPRFGSCYFLLKPDVSQRCTFTYLDSHYDPAEKGTLDEFDDILSALLAETFTRDFAIGENQLTPKKLVAHLNGELPRPFVAAEFKAAARNLNHYIESQVHGHVSLQDDVDILVADPSFKRTAVGEILTRLCDKYGIELAWHCGFALPVDEVPDDFRGPAMPSLARRIASGEFVAANMIGEAAFDLKRNPTTWSDRGTYAQVLQELKILWHVLVKCGKSLNSIVHE